MLPGADHHGGTIHAITAGPVASKLFRDAYVSTSLQGDMFFAAILLKTPKLFEDGIYGNRTLQTGCSPWLLTAAGSGGCSCCLQRHCLHQDQVCLSQSDPQPSLYLDHFWVLVCAYKRKPAVVSVHLYLLLTMPRPT